jgi:hypothetical protein
MKTRCRHERNSWIIGSIEWCYVCGSFRRLYVLAEKCIPRTKWIKPSGDKNNNPTKQLESIKLCH